MFVNLVHNHQQLLTTCLKNEPNVAAHFRFPMADRSDKEVARTVHFF